jgi:magnesium transporter
MLIFYYVDDNNVKNTSNQQLMKNILLSTKVAYLKAINPTDDEIEFLTHLLNLHIITLKNYSSKKHIPKIEEYENYISTIMYNMEYTNYDDCYDIKPVSIIMADNLVLTISKKNIQTFEEIVSRLSKNPELSFSSSCYLYYVILDALVDSLFPILTCFENKLDSIQEQLLKNDMTDCTEKITSIRRKLLELRKIFTYEKEVLYKLSHEKYRMINAECLTYFNDVFHHLERLNSMHQEYNDWALNISDAYDAYSSSKLNDKVQMLTIVSFIFLPLSFLTGWYGMNFKNMIELNLDYGYAFFIVAVILITISMIIYFKKKKIL